MGVEIGRDYQRYNRSRVSSIMMEVRGTSRIPGKSSLSVAKRVQHHGVKSVCYPRCSGISTKRESGVGVIRDKGSLNNSSNLITKQRFLGVFVYPNTAR